ncbi:MAG TPA: S1-like domain-containing RNA-binding protein [Bacilli bacterium]|mgnify:FL=1|jgi:predicted RNA-binding protein (virulence factor B family)|nr:S1-like domain-containing RNA-binding protein [Bacilli bacterium]
MAIKIGEINELTVKRETDISYTLTDGYEDFFLHFNQTPNPLQIGEKVKAFLYYDQKKRLCATLEQPFITATKYGLVKVVNIHGDAGVFVDIGISKDILLSKDFLPASKKLWPIVGDEIYCILKLKSDQLVARLLNKNDVDEIKSPLAIGSEVEGIVSHISDIGIGLFASSLAYIFVHKSLMRKTYRIGEKLTVKIININKHNDYNGSLIEQKELARIGDSKIILHALQVRGGVVPVGDASTPEEIFQAFKMSKGAFKRAVGLLYKEGLIIIEDQRIILKDFQP